MFDVPLSSGGGPISALNSTAESRAYTGDVTGPVVNFAAKTSWQDVAKWAAVVAGVALAVRLMRKGG